MERRRRTESRVRQACQEFGRCRTTDVGASNSQPEPDTTKQTGGGAGLVSVLLQCLLCSITRLTVRISLPAVRGASWRTGNVDFCVCLSSCTITYSGSCSA